MDRRLIAMRLVAPVFAALAIACGFGADEDDAGTGDTGSASMGSSSTAGDALGCGADGTNSQLVDDRCYCNEGFTWSDPFNPYGFTCERPERTWPPCHRYVSETSQTCECLADPTLPADATDCQNPVEAASDGNRCEVPGEYECSCPEGDAPCVCPSVYTCHCPAFFTWCSYEDLHNLTCCYDPGQDPDGSHAPSSTDGSTGIADTGTSDSTSSDTTSSGTSSDGSTGATGSTGGSSGTTG